VAEADADQEGEAARPDDQAMDEDQEPPGDEVCNAGDVTSKRLACLLLIGRQLIRDVVQPMDEEPRDTAAQTGPKRPSQMPAGQVCQARRRRLSIAAF
jgi:hypothetical protein